MTTEEILELYDKEQRRELQVIGTRREVTETVVRHVNLEQSEGFIAYTNLNQENADIVIAEQIAYFEKLEQPFEWKYYSHDKPENLLEHLRKHGFTIEAREALLALDLKQLPKKLQHSITHDIRLLKKPRELEDVLKVETEVWNSDHSDIMTYLEKSMETQPEMLRVYVAYIDDKPVSCAWMFFHEGSGFASLWGGSTIKEYRGRGIYTALVALRAQEAIKRGAGFLTVDASPRSQPILESLGFQFLAYTYPCKWKVKSQSQTTPHQSFFH
jgi:GNAT superfamily N-acetyltransferase